MSYSCTQRSVRDLNFFILNLCFTSCMFYTPVPVPVPVTRMEHEKDLLVDVRVCDSHTRIFVRSDFFAIFSSFKIS